MRISASAIGGSVNPVQEEERSIPAQLRGLDTVINDLGCQLERLESKLLPIMRVAPPKAVSQGKDETSSGCQLADILHQKIREIDNYANRIADCANRLEL